MAIPQRLSDWTLEAIEAIVDANQAEDDSYDFKEVLNNNSQGFREAVAKAGCSFANTRGGFIVFGVAEEGEGRERIKGIPFSREHGKQLSDKFNRADPPVRFEPLSPPLRLADGREIVVVEIFPRQRGPHRSPDGRFWKRQHGTASEMSYMEIEGAFADYSERRARMELVYVSLVDNWLRLIDIGGFATIGNEVSI